MMKSPDLLLLVYFEEYKGRRYIYVLMRVIIILPMSICFSVPHLVYCTLHASPA